MYLGLAAVGAGGFYLYRAGGDPKVAKDEMKCTPSHPSFLPYTIPWKIAGGQMLIG